LLDISVVIVLILGLIVILISCEIFTNGIEWLGVRMGLAETATGSVLAAVGTAMPETIVPLIAIFTGGTVAGAEVGVGAILGAPFMLGTLAMFIGGLTLYYRHKRGNRKAHLVVRRDHAERDMKHFMAMYTLALVAALLGFLKLFNHGPINYFIAIILLLAYGFYLRRTLSDERTEKTNTCPPLYLCRVFGFDAEKGRLGLFLILLQVLGALIGIIIGARIFVSEVEEVAKQVGIPAMILAFLIAPIATELPEKFNSVLWYLRGKDTLGFGNITGAMVFQSSIPVSIGLLFTDWIIKPINIASIVIALAASAWMFYSIRQKGGITYKVMLASGSLYMLYIVLLLIFGTG
jgi:cation:H+ antiporter